MSQLRLPLTLNDYAVFDTFHPAGNGAAVAHLEAIAEAPDRAGCWLWGANGTGKSHLLQATCAGVGKPAAYLPLADLRDAGAGILTGMEETAVLCLDDIDLVAGDDDWERALFNLFNRALETGAAIVAAAGQVPKSVGFALADLESRCAQLPPFRLQGLDDEVLPDALIRRARFRGLELPVDTAKFLVTHQRRDMASLYQLLTRLEERALADRRRLTVPFVKSVLAAEA